MGKPLKFFLIGIIFEFVDFIVTNFEIQKRYSVFCCRCCCCCCCCYYYYYYYYYWWQFILLQKKVSNILRACSFDNLTNCNCFQLLNVKCNYFLRTSHNRFLPLPNILKLFPNCSQILSIIDNYLQLLTANHNCSQLFLIVNCSLERLKQTVHKKFVASFESKLF